MTRAMWLLIPLLAGCTTASGPGCTIWGASPAVTVQLLFGRSIAGGGRVDDADWAAFLAGAVTPRFPDGLTVLEGAGQWRRRDTGRVGTEPSTVVEIVTEENATVAASLAAIRQDYRMRFHQESVGLVVLPGCASF